MKKLAYRTQLVLIFVGPKNKKLWRWKREKEISGAELNPGFINQIPLFHISLMILCEILNQGFWKVQLIWLLVDINFSVVPISILLNICWSLIYKLCISWVIIDTRYLNTIKNCCVDFANFFIISFAVNWLKWLPLNTVEIRAINL